MKSVYNELCMLGTKIEVSYGHMRPLKGILISDALSWYYIYRAIDIKYEEIFK